MTHMFVARAKTALIEALVAVAGRRGLPHRLREDAMLAAALLILRRFPRDERGL